MELYRRLFREIPEFRALVLVVLITAGELGLNGLYLFFVAGWLHPLQLELVMNITILILSSSFTEMLRKDPAEVERFLNQVREDRPKKKVMPYFRGSYRTAGFPLDVFTTAEYDSPAKRERIAKLASMAAR